MRNEKKNAEWFLWLWEYGAWVTLAAFVVITSILGLMSYQLDHRLSDIELRLTYAPPRAYEQPDFDRYPADGVSLSDLTYRHLVYVPVYSHVYYQGGAPYQLEATLSIRNVSPEQSIFLESVKYYDTQGELARSFLDKLIKLAPLQTIEFLVERHDSTGGSGANFLVAWSSDVEVDQPMIETVMVGSAGTQGISFSRSGVEVSTQAQK